MSTAIVLHPGLQLHWLERKSCQTVFLVLAGYERSACSTPDSPLPHPSLKVNVEFVRLELHFIIFYRCLICQTDTADLGTAIDVSMKSNENQFIVLKTNQLYSRLTNWTIKWQELRHSASRWLVLKKRNQPPVRGKVGGGWTYTHIHTHPLTHIVHNKSTARNNSLLNKIHIK